MTRGVAAPLSAAALAAAALVALAPTAWGPAMHGHAHGVAPTLAAVAWLGGWLLMAVALMVPAATPLVARAVRGRGFLAAGYLLAWTAAGLGALAVTLAVGPAQPGAESLAALPLLAAGAYELSPWKRRALAHCRAHARRRTGAGPDPRADALGAGLRHGAASLRCCGPLMIALPPLGLGLAAMLAAGSLLALQEATPWGARLRFPLGLATLTIALALLI